MEIEGHGGKVTEKLGAYIAPGNHHSFAGSETNLFLVVDVPHELKKMRENPRFLPINRTLKEFCTFAHVFLAENDSVSANHLLYQLLMTLIGCESASHRSVLIVKEWIEKNLCANIDISKLAKLCHLSKSQLQRHFREDTGLGLAEYWRMKKLERAQLLLTQTQYSIEQVAYEIGYESPAAFSRRFLEYFGTSPLKWRKMTQSAKKTLLKDKSGN